VNPAALNGWAITRIPPETPSLTWSVKGTVSIVGVSNVVLEEDYVDFARYDASDAWVPALKL
jgi:hypothetical protein